MARSKRTVGGKIIAGLEEAVRHMRGERARGRITVVTLPDVKSLRKRLGYSQSTFAIRFGLNVRTVQDWEQKRVLPDPAARSLLAVIAHSPKVVERAIQRSSVR
jgi:putative transcriptional regulator